MKSKSITFTDPKQIRDISDSNMFLSVQSKKSKENGHKFKVGDKRILTGLQDFPEFNGQEVTISAIREDGDNGKAYYIDGKINLYLNWVYEYRLK